MGQQRDRQCLPIFLYFRLDTHKGLRIRVSLGTPLRVPLRASPLGCRLPFKGSFEALRLRV